MPHAHAHIIYIYIYTDVETELLKNDGNGPRSYAIPSL